MLIACTTAVMLLANAARAENWPRFRGPHGTGVSSESDLPLNWDGKSGENVLWKAPLTGTTGWSCPIVWQDRVVVTMSDKQTRQQEEAKEIPIHHVACFAAADGKELWRTRIEPGKEVAGYNIYASPTPVTDGKRVYAWFGSGVLVALDFDGKLLWRQTRPGPFSLNPGICSSPTLYDDTLLLICDQNRGQGFLQGIDTKTGKVKWEQKRPKTGACNATPLLIDVKGQKELLVAGENVLQGLRPDSGEPIWWCKSRGFGASPVYADGIVYADKGSNELAQAIDPVGEGDITQTNVKWKIEKLPGDYASPVVSHGVIYRVQTEGVMSVYSLKSGEKLFTTRLEGLPKTVSPIATADGRVYFVSTGTSHVLKAGPTLEVLATNKLGGGGNCSSPAVSGGKIYIRDFENLYCIGRK